MTTDLRKTFEKNIIIGFNEETKKALTRKYYLKQMSLDDTLDCLPVIGEMLGLPLFSIVSNALAKGDVSKLTQNIKEVGAKFFTTENKNAIQEFISLWRKNNNEIKYILKLMIKDGYYEVGADDGSVIQKPIIYEDFTADDLIVIAELFIFGVVEVNFKRFFDQFRVEQDLEGKTQSTKRLKRK